MILFYDADLRHSQLQIWSELNFAWSATFHSDLHPHVLERWPEDGTHGGPTLGGIEMAVRYTTPCADTSRKALHILWRVVAPPHGLRSPAPAPATPVPRSLWNAEFGKGASKKRRDADPVRMNSRFANYIRKHIIYTLFN